MMDKDAPGQSPNEATGLPGLRSWRAVYLVVLGTFVLWVALLTTLTHVFVFS